MKKLLLLALLPLTAMATPIKGINETYQDWNLVCDNTGTCRMAGYQSAAMDCATIVGVKMACQVSEEQSEKLNNPVSILFTRKAGDKESVSAQLKLTPIVKAGKEVPIGKISVIRLNGESLDAVINYKDKPSVLNETQTLALLNALKQSSKIEVFSGENQWLLSDKGAAAAMLKMDEFQQRLNKPSALMRKGENKAASLRPQPVPKIQAVKIPNRKTYSIERGSAKFDKVMALLRQSNGTNENSESYCSALYEDKSWWTDNIEIYPLTHGKVLAESICWAGPSGDIIHYYAVMDENLTRVEQVLANQYNQAEYDKASHILTVSGSFRRGVADCFDGGTAVWNGKIFIRTSEWTTGLCKGFMGGAWELPTFVSEVVAK